MLVSSEVGVISNVRNMLQSFGIRNIEVGKNLKHLETYLLKNQPDIIICSAEFPEGDSCEVIRNIRHGELGNNPFVPIIMFTRSPSQETVRNIVSSGMDALIILPFSTQQLLERIQSIAENRKSFVVTSDYLGPDRRPESRSVKDIAITKFDVPNPLRVKVTGKREGSGEAIAPKLLLDNMQLHRLECQPEHLVNLVNQIKEAENNGVYDDKAKSALMTLQAITSDMSARLEGTKYAHVSGLCDTLLQVIKDIANFNGNSLEKNITLLFHISSAIQLGFSDTKSVHAAQEITDTVAFG